MSRRVLKAEQFELTSQLGSGSFGEVYQAMDKITGQVVAIKKIDVESCDDDIEEIQKEIAILAGCNDKRITRYYGSFVNGYKLWIIMEYLGGGSCLDLLQVTGPFSERAIAMVCVELLKGLKYLHANGNIHRDIKAANLLVSDTGDVKIADFGVAAQLSSNLSCRNTFVGTPFWMAPEVIGQKDYTYSADIWSLGITAIELSKGKPPLSHLHPMEVLFYIPKNPPPRLDEKFSKTFRDFVAQCLQKRPEDRPTVGQLLKHPFLKLASKTELINRVHEWKRVDNSKQKPIPAPPTVDESTLPLSEDEDDEHWIFDTVKPDKTKSPPSVSPSPKKKLSRMQSNISALKRSSTSSLESSVLSSRIPSPTYQNHNFDLTPHDSPLKLSESSSYFDTYASGNTVDTLPASSPDRRTILVRAFSEASTKFNERSLAEIAEILTVEPIPLRVEQYIIKKISKSTGDQKEPHKDKKEKSKRYDSVESMFLQTWISEAAKR